jgi:hypothetical protein
MLGIMASTTDHSAGKIGQNTATQIVAMSIAVIAALLMAASLLYSIYFIKKEFQFWPEILRYHYAAIIGLPSAAIFSFILVVLLRQIDGPIIIEGFGFKFQGAAGQIVMWILCFLAMAAGIKICW